MTLPSMVEGPMKPDLPVEPNAEQVLKTFDPLESAFANCQRGSFNFNFKLQLVEVTDGHRRRNVHRLRKRTMRLFRLYY